MLILDGKIVRNEIRESLAEMISKQNEPPVLVIFQVGNRQDSNAYIEQKKKFAEAIGARLILEKFTETIAQDELLGIIKKYNKDTSVHGMILQIPIPHHLDKDELLEAIDPAKDIDGLTSTNTKLLFDGRSGGFMPATARGIVTLLDYYKIQLHGKNVTVVGRSALVGKPVALACLNRDATVTIAHKETSDLKAVTQAADILIVAIGDPEFITKDYVREGQIVIDVGINPQDSRLVGDVLHHEVEKIVHAITPVPGGVGPMTVASLFQNLVDAYAR